MNKLGRGPSFKKTILLVAICSLLYLCALAAMFMPKTFGQAQKRPAEFASTYTQYIVEPGDTLYDIARRLYPGRDWREVVHEVRVVNGITPVIRPGQKIWIPRNDLKEAGT